GFVKMILSLVAAIISIALAGELSEPIAVRINDAYLHDIIVEEIDKSCDGGEGADRLYIHNISGEKINSVKIIYGEASFDEADRDAEPDWSEYDNRLKEPIRVDDYSYCDLDVAEDLKTLWVRIDTSDRHCVFAVVYEAGCRIDVNIRKSDT
ncbi:MAG: hypothetical protein II196_01980, partial [Spirochaetales bacterium]|nr:hypothetical protein [Spirochaetales bacterium]